MAQRVIVLLTLLFSFYFSPAQDVAREYGSLINEEVLRPFLEVLTSDSLEGRETGKPGQKKAAAYIADQFRNFGLKPLSHGSFFQHTYLSARANPGKNFQVNQKYFVFMKDYFYPPGFPDSLYILDTVVFAGYGISSTEYDDYASVNVRGRAVIFFDGRPRSKKSADRMPGTVPIPPETDLWLKLETAREKGASLAFVVTDSIHAISEFYNYGKNDRKVPKPSIPFAFVTREMAPRFFPEPDEEKLWKSEKKIVRKGRPFSYVSSSQAELSFVSDTDKMRGENVAGFLEGTDKKDEVVILTAHYDHLGVRDSMIYYGADDDASGTSAVLAMAEMFSKAAKDGIRPRRSILFMPVSGEEKGLLGSKYYVRYPLVPLNQTIANLNIDMIGRTDKKYDSLKADNYVYIIGSDKLSSTLHQINERANATYTKLDLDYMYNKPDDPNRYYYRSDHYNFAKNRIPVIFYFNGSHIDYHKPSDTPDKIRYDLLSKRTQLVFYTAWELANREERIVVDVESDMPDRREE